MKVEIIVKENIRESLNKDMLTVIPACRESFLKNRNDCGQAAMTEVNEESSSLFFFISHPSSFILRKRGFTLLEVLIALAILSSLLITLIYTVNYQLGLVERQETITVATLLAKSKMADLEKDPAGSKGEFDAPHEQYSYETFVKASPYIGVSEIIVVVKAGSEEVKLNEFIVQ